jgi:D-alanine-D-alanine ligase-like ATP-grasp enzyme
MRENNRQKCSACGTSPVNHRFLFILNVMDETFGKYADRVFSFTQNTFWQKTANKIEKILFTILYYIGLVRYNGNDITKAPTGRSKIIWEEAIKRNIPMEQVIMFGKPIDYYRAKIDTKRNGKWFYFQSLPVPPALPQGGYKWLDDKFVLLKRLREADIPAPATEKITTWKKAVNAFGGMQKPVIIKPKFGSRGRHTTTNIKTEQELKQAFSLARQITPWMVLQEHLEGSVCRATVINGELVGFFRADSPQVTGDGIKNIRELILEKNKTRNEKLSEILINDDLLNFIERQNYALESILPKNQVVNLSAKTGRMYGGYTREMLSEIHPKIHSIFKKAGELVEAPVAGFDLIIEDPTKDPDLQHWGIIECNSLPFLDLHYFALEGTPIHLGANVWDLWNIKN